MWHFLNRITFAIVSLSRFVIHEALSNKSMSHFVLPDPLCNI